MSTPFAELGVPAELVRTLHARGIDSAFPIQALTLPDGLSGRDLCGRAPTGSGKTLAFGIPIVARVGRAEPRRPRGLVLVPTRELAAQVCGELEWLGGARKLRVAAVYGGAGYGLQLKQMRRGVDVLVACPGRLTDLIERGEVDLDQVELVVVDEADRMADMGFLPAVQRLLDRTPESRQTLLFSATLDGAVDTLVRRYQRDPSRHLLPEDEHVNITHLFWEAERDERAQLTADVVKLAGPTIVFCRTKHGADQVTRRLEQRGVRSVAIHGNRSQGQRERALAAFSEGRFEALVATDVAARGIHVDAVACVVHYDPPADAKDYTHRSGRTARAGSSGTVVSLVGREQRKDTVRLQRALGLRGGVDAPDRKALASLTPDAVTARADIQAPSNSRSARTVARASVTASRPAPKDKVAVAVADPAWPSGTVKWFDARRGFGFIERHDGDDLFVHRSAVEGVGGQRLLEGQLVAFEVGPGRRGEEARSVKVLVHP